MKGIVLAGGSGSRLHPITKGTSKQLLPVYSKPMIYYPLSVLMLADIREVLIITLPEDESKFRKLLGDGSQWGMRIEYALQPEPRGLAEAFIIADKSGFLKGGHEGAALVLGDNIFYGGGLTPSLRRAAARDSGASVFAYWVKDPERYGVIEFDSLGAPKQIQEKPKVHISPYALTGVYFFDSQVVQIANGIKPSSRGELEITEIMNFYLKSGQLNVEILGRGIAWLDTGTPEALHQAANFVEAIEERQGLKISCPEEIAFRQGWISKDQLGSLARSMKSNAYGQYLERLLAEAVPSSKTQPLLT